jgi:hypothetical protein
MSVLDDLGRRLVACPEWLWMRRMVDTNGHTFLGELDGDWAWIDTDGRIYNNKPWKHEAPPDLTDPATLGCLESMIENFVSVGLAGTSSIYWLVAYVAPEDEYGRRMVRTLGKGDTKGEALARALLTQRGAL